MVPDELLALLACVGVGVSWVLVIVSLICLKLTPNRACRSQIVRCLLPEAGIVVDDLIEPVGRYFLSLRAVLELQPKFFENSIT